MHAADIAGIQGVVMEPDSGSGAQPPRTGDVDHDGVGPESQHGGCREVAEGAVAPDGEERRPATCQEVRRRVPHGIDAVVLADQPAASQAMVDRLRRDAG